MAIEEKWDVKKGARIFSRLTFAQVKGFISRGVLKEDDLVWHSGLSGWRKASDVEELKRFFQKLTKE